MDDTPAWLTNPACSLHTSPGPRLAATPSTQAANVGDTSAYFIDPATGRARELTEDHRLTNPRERQRLQDMGIQVGGCTAGAHRSC